MSVIAEFWLQIEENGKLVGVPCCIFGEKLTVAIGEFRRRMQKPHGKVVEVPEPYDVIESRRRRSEMLAELRNTRTGRPQ